jgi:hypothetical protein
MFTLHGRIINTQQWSWNIRRQRFVQDEIVDPSPQASLPSLTSNRNLLYSGSVLSDYPWSAWSQDAQFESPSGNVLYPNLGMLANSHLGLANLNQNVKVGKWRSMGSDDRSVDVSTGANTLYHASTFKVASEKIIGIGEEIFADYGVNYFHHREEKFQMVFPTADNYQEADEIVRDFAKRLEGKDEFTVEDEEEWKNVILKLEEDTDKIRVAFALPDSVEDIRYVAEVGTARYSIPESVRSIEWLQENGFCLDNLRVGKSSIPYAGNGRYNAKRLHGLCFVCVNCVHDTSIHDPLYFCQFLHLYRCICREKYERRSHCSTHASYTNTTIHSEYRNKKYQFPTTLLSSWTQQTITAQLLLWPQEFFAPILSLFLIGTFCKSQ